jgi:CubicO group peptidase (beta-lactamase class C family)
VIEDAETSTYRRKQTRLSEGGGLVSTAADYMKFCQMLLARGALQGERLLRPETVSIMTVNELLGSAYPTSVSGDIRHGVGFGLGLSVVVEKIPGAPYVPIGEYGLGGAGSAHFWLSPADELAVVVLTQFAPFSPQVANAVKPIVYGAIIERR